MGGDATAGTADSLGQLDHLDGARGWQAADKTTFFKRGNEPVDA
jgi:hypothetical protein